ncbi:type II secretion system protein GspL [Thalassotalea agarivorans]|uniref:Type II secretion system protein L n=1 Tax=Thalassotalea agarivorans TaxID=349064 RepID=A0A1I0E6P4_THASX|nr:type II secretion system protein GspL [Thalassotalea agarivorans]SET39919.1 general secretion pathway protein L [Thalassotalea agarivorans]
MAETLYIRLGSLPTQSVHWLITASDNEEIIASGQLDSAAALTELTEKASTRKTTVFVPASDVALHQLQVPGSARDMKRVVPFMLEDELAQPVESLFFAYGNAPKNPDYNCFVAAVETSQMQMWLDVLAAADIKTKTFIPDVLAMPLMANAASAIMLEQQTLIRLNAWQGYTLDEATWGMLNDSMATPAEDTASDEQEEQEIVQQVIHHYSPLHSTAEDVQYIAEPEVLPLALLAKHAHNAPVNLLQGQFKIVEKRSAATTQWVIAASFAAVALLLNVGMKANELLHLSREQAAIEAHIITVYKDTFPDTKRVRTSTIKSQLNRKLKEVGDGSNGDGFLIALEKIKPAFIAVPAMKPVSLKFDGKRQEIRIQATAKDYQAFDAFQQALEKEKLSVNQGSQNNQGDSISGSFSIKVKP